MALLVLDVTHEQRNLLTYGSPEGSGTSTIELLEQQNKPYANRHLETLAPIGVFIPTKGPLSVEALIEQTLVITSIILFLSKVFCSWQ